MRRRTHNHLILMSVLFWVLALGGLLSYLTQGSAAAEQGAETGRMVARQCIENAFPVISRGAADREASAAGAAQQDSEPQTEALGNGDGAAEDAGGENAGPDGGSRLTGALKGLVDRTFPYLTAQTPQTDEEKAPDDEMLVAQNTGEEQKTKPQDDGKTAGGNGQGGVQDAAAEPEKPAVPVLDTAESKEPLVLIFHTHATESYQPVSDGNFHSTAEAGTVREVGNELEKALEAKGIPVIHDKTLHDNPSYNESYSRSIQTVKNYLQKNPSIKIVIDLHRDAASYSGNVGKTTAIGGKKVATYSLVIGKGNANVDKLHLFANRINQIANQLYPGLAGKVIDKEYRFNQYVCDQYLLLEVGNNENTIEQVKLTGKYFADILEAYIKAYPQN